MFCTKCESCCPTNKKNLDLKEFRIEGIIQQIDCHICDNFLALICDGEVINVNDVVDKNVQDGWIKVRVNRDKILYYILSQIIYPQFDTPRKDKYECYYDFSDDLVFLRWFNYKPVGFYTIKPKGTEIISYAKKYQMSTVDTAYVRSEYRNRGLGLEILYDVVARCQEQDIGFSKPISDGMFKVLRQFLMKHKEYRLRFWEIEDGGMEGSAKLVWFILQKKLKN